MRGFADSSSDVSALGCAYPHWGGGGGGTSGQRGVCHGTWMLGQWGGFGAMPGSQWDRTRPAVVTDGPSSSGVPVPSVLSMSCGKMDNRSFFLSPKFLLAHFLQPPGIELNVPDLLIQ